MFDLLLLAACDGDDSTPAVGDSGVTDSGDTLDSGPDSDSSPDSSAGPRTCPLDSCAEAKFVGAVDEGTYVVAAGDLDADGLGDVAWLVCLDGDIAQLSVMQAPFEGKVGRGAGVATVTGTEAEASGIVVARAGDTNGDGHADLLLGSLMRSDEDHEGYVYLLPGPFVGDSSLDSAITFAGDHCYDYYDDAECQTGKFLGSAGDVNDDGFDDVLIGAPGDPSVYLLRGPIAASGDLRSVYDTRLDFSTSDHLRAAASAGDLDGDGLDEFMVGFYDYDDRGTWLVFQSTTPTEATADDAIAAYVGETDGLSADGALSADDADGDGYDDLLFGCGSHAGAAYVVLGPSPGGEIDVPSTAVARFEGIDANDLAGTSVAALGDLDGDNLPEIAVGAPGVDQPDDNAWGPGAVYVLFGPYSGTTSLADAPITLEGDNHDQAGDSVYAAGDTDGDGIPDLLVTGPHDDEGGALTAGAAWLVSGATLLSL